MKSKSNARFRCIRGIDRIGGLSFLAKIGARNVSNLLAFFFVSACADRSRSRLDEIYTHGFHYIRRNKRSRIVCYAYLALRSRRIRRRSRQISTKQLWFERSCISMCEIRHKGPRFEQNQLALSPSCDEKKIGIQVRLFRCNATFSRCHGLRSKLTSVVGHR
jgi:hypothetical protein